MDPKRESKKAKAGEYKPEKMIPNLKKVFASYFDLDHTTPVSLDLFESPKSLGFVPVGMNCKPTRLSDNSPSDVIGLKDLC